MYKLHEYPIGDEVKIGFSDKNYTFSLNANVLRTNEQDGHYVCGCILTKAHQNIEKYIMMKQRQELMQRTKNDFSINEKRKFEMENRCKIELC